MLNRPLRIGCDLDGCVFNFFSVFLPYVYQRTGVRFFYDEIVAWDWYFGKEPEKNQKLLFSCLETFGPDGFAVLPQRGNASKILAEIKARGHEIIYITGREPNRRKATCVSFEYANILVNYNELIFTQLKSEVAKELELDFHIDDYPLILTEIADVIGRSVVFDAPYNQDVRDERITRVYNWEEVLEYVKKLETEII